MWLWDRSQPEPAPLDENLARLTDETGTSLSTPSGSDPSPESIVEEYNIKIETIVGPGDLEVEYVEISNESPSSVDMTNWQLTDEDGLIFTFPTIILNQDGEIKVLPELHRSAFEQNLFQFQAAVKAINRAKNDNDLVSKLRNLIFFKCSCIFSLPSIILIPPVKL